MENINHTHRNDGFKEFRIIWERRKWLILLSFIIPFSLITSMVVNMPKLYRSSVTILVTPDNPDEFSKWNDPGLQEARMQTINEETLSRSSLKKLIESHDLYPDLRKNKTMETAIQRMRKDILLRQKEINIKSSLDTSVAYTLSYQGWDPDVVARITNILADKYIEENEKQRERLIMEKSEKVAPDTLAVLKQELHQLQTRFSDQYPDVINIKAKITALEQQQKHKMSAGKKTEKAKSKSPILEKQLHVIDPALPSKDAIAPNINRLLLIAFVLSMGMTGLITMLAEKLNNSTRTLSDVWAITDIPVLAAIPRIVSKGEALGNFFRNSVVTLLLGVGLFFMIKASYYLGQSTEQLVWLLAQRGM